VGSEPENEEKLKVGRKAFDRTWWKPVQATLRTLGWTKSIFFVYYESIKREVKRRPMYEYRCDERLKVTGEGSTRLVHTGLGGGLEHLKIR